MGWRDVLIDAWASVSHKAPLREDTDARINGWTPKSWIPALDRRRLAAYAVLAGYDANVARFFVDPATGVDTGEVADRREYGDAALIIDSVLANVLGEDQTITVPGADTDADTDADEEDAPVTPERVAQDALRAWAKDEQFALKLQDGERKTVRDGDAVYLLTWSTRKARPTLAVLDGGFYFPVLPDNLDASEFPERVHFAWEIPGEQFPDGKTRVRRITYALGAIMPTWDDEAADWVWPDDVTYDAERGTATRRLAYADEPVDRTCYLTDATWVLEDTAAGVDALDPSRASFAVDEEGQLLDHVDLGIDFLPIVHLPNTPAGADHFGQSSLAKVLQVLDDLHSADTDTAKASATTGSPIVAVSGTRVTDETRVVGPGEVWGLGENGRMDVLDTAAQLEGMRAYVDALLKRLATNARLPGVLLGTQPMGEVDSDFRAVVAMQPLIAMVRSMRLTRQVKYPLLFKMVLRLMAVAGDYTGPTDVDAELVLGSFLPQDQAKVLEQVTSGVEKGVLSLETGVRMLQAAGFPIEDAVEEVRLIQSRSFAAANELADATNDPVAVRDYLGLEAAVESPVPVPSPTPLPTGPEA